MTISPEIIRFIGGHEGFVSKWYLDPTGTPTMGFGFTWGSRIFRAWSLKKYGRKFRRGDKITLIEADGLLRAILKEEYAPPVFEKLKGQSYQIIGPALSMVFNAGLGALNWQWAKLIARGDKVAGIKRWRTTATTSRGKRLPGLVRRRNEEADIAQYNRWPGWMEANIPILRRVPKEDVEQAQKWLEALGFHPGPIDGLRGVKTIAAIKAFQEAHPNLIMDGRLGPATLSALQRAVDFKLKGAVIGGGGAMGTGAGMGADAGMWNNILVWGSVGLIVAGALYLGWKYRDEIQRLMGKL